MQYRIKLLHVGWNKHWKNTAASSLQCISVPLCFNSGTRANSEEDLHQLGQCSTGKGGFKMFCNFACLSVWALFGDKMKKKSFFIFYVEFFRFGNIRFGFGKTTLETSVWPDLTSPVIAPRCCHEIQIKITKDNLVTELWALLTVAAVKVSPSMSQQHSVPSQ